MSHEGDSFSSYRNSGRPPSISGCYIALRLGNSISANQRNQHDPFMIGSPFFKLIPGIMFLCTLESIVLRIIRRCIDGDNLAASAVPHSSSRKGKVSFERGEVMRSTNHGLRPAPTLERQRRMTKVRVRGNCPEMTALERAWRLGDGPDAKVEAWTFHSPGEKRSRYDSRLSLIKERLSRCRASTPLNRSSGNARETLLIRKQPIRYQSIS